MLQTENTFDCAAVKIESAEASPVRAMLITDYVFWSGKPEA